MKMPRTSVMIGMMADENTDAAYDSSVDLWAPTILSQECHEFTMQQ